MKKVIALISLAVISSIIVTLGLYFIFDNSYNGKIGLLNASGSAIETDLDVHSVEQNASNSAFMATCKYNNKIIYENEEFSFSSLISVDPNASGTYMTVEQAGMQYSIKEICNENFEPIMIINHDFSRLSMGDTFEYNPTTQTLRCSKHGFYYILFELATAEGQKSTMFIYMYIGEEPVIPQGYALNLEEQKANAIKMGIDVEALENALKEESAETEEKEEKDEQAKIDTDALNTSDVLNDSEALETDNKNSENSESEQDSENTKSEAIKGDEQTEEGDE